MANNSKPVKLQTTNAKRKFIKTKLYEILVNPFQVMFQFQKKQRKPNFVFSERKDAKDTFLLFINNLRLQTDWYRFRSFIRMRVQLGS